MTARIVVYVEIIDTPEKETQIFDNFKRNLEELEGIVDYEVEITS